MTNYFVFDGDVIKVEKTDKPGIYVLVNKKWTPYTDNTSLTDIVVEFNAARHGYSDVYSVDDVKEISEEEVQKYL